MGLTTPNNIPQIKALIGGLLDAGYASETQALLAAFAAESQSGSLQLRLQQLEAEAQRLAANGEKLTENNPVLIAVLNDLQPVLKRNAARLTAIASRMIGSGINVAAATTGPLAFGFPPNTNLGIIAVDWNNPDPEMIAELVALVDDPLFKAEIEAYEVSVYNTVRNFIIREIANGKGPLWIARELTRLITDYPLSRAQTLMRTLQLTAYRRATAAHQAANQDIIEQVVRIAVLDGRTCMSCVALHGTVLKAGDMVLDHHNGRCTSISIIKGRPRQIMTGIQWFNLQDAEVQQRMMGKKAFAAWQAGEFGLSDYVKPYQDDLFGEMLRQASLKELVS